MRYKVTVKYKVAILRYEIIVGDIKSQIVEYKNIVNKMS